MFYLHNKKWSDNGSKAEKKKIEAIYYTQKAYFFKKVYLWRLNFDITGPYCSTDKLNEIIFTLVDMADNF